MNDNISIVMTLKNRANLLKYCLEAISRQEYDLSKIEICILDGGSTDSLWSIVDRYSDVFTFRLCEADRLKSYLPIVSNFPGVEINLGAKYLSRYDKIIKIDPEVVIKDEWLLSEVNELLDKDDSRMYNSRTHFTAGEFYSSLDDIIKSYEKHYHYAENGPFTRSRYWFCSSFSRSKFLELRGVEELFGFGTGYDDDGLRTSWKNRYGNYEYEITAQSIHLDHGGNKFRPTKEYLNKRTFDHLKKQDLNNVVRLKGGTLVRDENTLWANPEMLSKIYTVKDGSVVNVEDINNGTSSELSLPF